MKKALALLLATILLTAGLATFAMAEDPINLIWIQGGTEATDHAKVWEKLNEMSARDIGVTVTQKIYDGEKASLAMTTGEPCDIIFTCEWYNNYAVRANDGYFADITDLVTTAAPDLYAFIPELVWKGAKVNGKVYAVPVYKDTAAAQYVMVEKQYVDELGLDISAVDSLEKVGDVAKAIKEAHPEMYPITLWRNGLGSALDSIYDVVNREVMIGLPYSSADTKIYSMFEHPEYIARLDLMRAWNQAGYINPDATTLLEEQSVKVSAIRTAQGWPGADVVTWNPQFNTTFVINKIYGPVLSTSSARGAMNAVTATSQYPEKALEYLQYANLNPEYRNMLRYGIEGEHYTTNDDGTITIVSDGYQGVWGFAQGTFFTLKAVAPAPADLWDQVKALNDSATAGPTLGFSFDIIPVEDQVSTCQVIIDKYKYDLFCGMVDVQPTLDKMLEELNAAGYQDIIAEAQAQLDAFLAAQ